MHSVGEVEHVGGEPAEETRPRVTVPGEGSCRDRLLGAVHRHRAVRCCAPEVIAPGWITRVAVRAWIYDERLTEGRALKTKQVRMTMACAGRAANGPGVED